MSLLLLAAQLFVVAGLLLWIEQADLGRGEFVEDLLRGSLVLAGLIGSHVTHLPIGGVGDHLDVRLERLHAQQTIVIGRLMPRRDAKPAMVRIELVHHDEPPLPAREAPNSGSACPDQKTRNSDYSEIGGGYQDGGLTFPGAYGRYACVRTTVDSAAAR